MLNSTCALITDNFLLNCDNPLQSGTRDRAIIFNFDDFLQLDIMKNAMNKQIIEGITLPSGITGYSIQGINNSITPKVTMKKGKFLNSYTHEVSFPVFSLNPIVKQEIELLDKGRFVIFTENNYQGDNGEAAYEIYGMGSGLVASVTERDPSNADTQGGYTVTLTSSDVSQEAHLPATLFLTDYATTKAIFDSLAA